MTFTKLASVLCCVALLAVAVPGRLEATRRELGTLSARASLIHLALTLGITCAILVSKNAQAALITEVLRKNGVEATDEAKSSVIEDNPATAGLLALIQATVHPDNGLARGLAEISPASAKFLKAHGGWEAASLAIAQTFVSKGAEALGALGALAGQLGEVALDLAPDAADRDAEHALAALHEVDHLVLAAALVHARSVTHEGDLGEVVHAPLAQVLDGHPDVLQGDAAVEKSLDHLEDEDVAEAVEALAARAVGRADARSHDGNCRPCSRRSQRIRASLITG